MTNDVASTIDVDVDVLIIGGGVAGLWTLARLQQAGYKTVLLESQSLGAGQTRYAQGIIHGGTKYALTGKLTASSEAVADMPARWRACYEGNGELDLSQAELLSDAHYLWSTTSLTSRISGFFASKVMRARSTAMVDRESLPTIFRNKNFNGQFYRLDEPVFNTLSVIRALAEPRLKNILQIEQSSIQTEDDSLMVRSKQGDVYRFDYKKIIFMAGKGNGELLARFSCDTTEMQLRPLKMVVMRGSASSPLRDMVYAHCLGSSVNPRITITSHRDNDGNIVWYMGGQLAEDGVARDDADLIQTAKDELDELIPWLNLNDVSWGVLKIDRAEIKKRGSVRPDSFSVEEDGRRLYTWPTKMALSPALADAVLELLEAENMRRCDDSSLPAWASCDYADFPWNDETVWRSATGDKA